MTKRYQNALNAHECIARCIRVRNGRCIAAAVDSV